MSKFAKISEAGVVAQVFVGDLAKAFHPSIAAEFVPVGDDVEVGMIRNSKGKYDPAPEVEVTEDIKVTEPETILSPVEFMDLFKPEEEAAIRLGARSTEYPEVAVQMEMFLDRVRTAGAINLSDPRVLGGLAALKTAGIIDEKRRKKIAAGEAPS